METNENQTLDPIPEEQITTPTKHSGLGIASFILASIGFVLVIIAAVLVTGSITEITQTFTEEELINGTIDPSQVPPALIAGVVLFFFVIFLNLIGGILGIIGIFIKNRKKLFAILGTIFNLIGFVIFIVLMLIGFATQGLM
jgi:uncharacterized membrane protein